MDDKVTLQHGHRIRIRLNKTKEKIMTIANSLEQHTTRLNKFAYRLTQNHADAKDLVQDTFLRALEKQHLYQDRKGSSLYSWLSKIMYNLFVSGFRRKRKFESGADPEELIKNKSVPATQESKVELDQVKKEISSMSEKYKNVIAFVCYQQMPYEEASEKLRIPVGTVRSRLSRARSKLNASMDYRLAA